MSSPYLQSWMMVLRFDGIVAGAALGVQEVQQLLQRFGVCAIAQEGAFAA